MIIRRTGAKRGERPIWYVQADRPEEFAAIRRNEVRVQPTGRIPNVLAWGLSSREDAQAALDELALAFAATRIGK